jgi:signal transduction histidine kinase
VQEDIGRLETIAKRLDSDLDFLVWQLRPTALDDLGLKAALTDYVDNWARHFEIPVHVDLAGLEGSAPEHDVETVFYRTVQEALNNIAKHSRAKNVRITIAREANELVLAVGDDGVGFDARKAMASGTGLGLVGMRERASLVGGSFEVESRPGGGATLRIRVPAGSG